jgi:hypothetical protein
MDFDFTLETISPNSGTILTVGSTGAIEVSAGTLLQRPATPINGMLRYNTDTGFFEGYEANAWVNFSGINNVNSAPYSSIANSQTATNPGNGNLKWNNALR